MPVYVHLRGIQVLIADLNFPRDSRGSLGIISHIFGPIYRTEFSLYKRENITFNMPEIKKNVYCVHNGIWNPKRWTI